MISAASVSDQVRLASNPARLRAPAFRVIDRLQGYRPGEQLLGAGVALVAMADAIELDLHSLIATARNVMAHADGPYSEQIAAIRDYAKNELRRS